MGFLASTELVECSASDLVGEYVGQTGPKTRELFEKAIGKVLFVDEAYRLSQGHFAQEAIDEVVGLMTNKKFMGKMVIILAGYEKDMNRLLGANPGLSSRFSEEFLLPNMSPSRCLELLDKELRESKVILDGMLDSSSSLYEDMLNIITDMASLETWGNARDVKTIAKKLARPALISAGKVPGGSLVIPPEEALRIMRDMLSERRERLPLSNESMSTAPSVPSMAMSRNFAPPPPSTSQSMSTPAPPEPPASKAASRKRKRQQSTKESPQHTAASSQVSTICPIRERKITQKSLLTQTNKWPQRDPGVDDATWSQLQKDKEAEKNTAGELRMCNIAHHNALMQLRSAEAATRKLAKKVAKGNTAASDDLMRKREAARIRELQAKAVRQNALAALREKQEEEEKRKREEVIVQQKLRQMGVCVAGFRWIKQSGGYRCAGGSHFISNALLDI